MRKWVILCSATTLAVVVGLVVLEVMNNQRSGVKGDEEGSALIGAKIADYQGVPAYQNGTKIEVSHGKHYANDGYYYGQKWQCVEYVKRFYYDALKHRMPNVWGHAADFFDPETEHGAINSARGLVQYKNGNNVAPKPDDLLVFRHDGFGHVAIITKVTKNTIEVIQQNVHGSPTSVHTLTRGKEGYTVGEKHQPAGWLRLP